MYNKNTFNDRDEVSISLPNSDTKSAKTSVKKLKKQLSKISKKSKKDIVKLKAVDKKLGKRGRKPNDSKLENLVVQAYNILSHVIDNGSVNTKEMKEIRSFCSNKLVKSIVKDHNRTKVDISKHLDKLEKITFELKGLEKMFKSIK